MNRNNERFNNIKIGPDENQYHPGYPETIDDKINNSIPYPSKFFKKVPEAPTFFPTHSEFAYPHEYIHSIIPEMEPYGIAKIVPPERYLNMMGLTYSKELKKVISLHQTKKQDSDKRDSKDTDPHSNNPLSPQTPQSRRKSNFNIQSPDNIEKKSRSSNGFVQTTHWKNLKVKVKQQNIHQLMERLKTKIPYESFVAKDNFFISSDRPIISHYQYNENISNNTINSTFSPQEKFKSGEKRKATTPLQGKNPSKRKAIDQNPILLYCRNLQSENVTIPGADLTEMNEYNFGFPRLSHVYTLKDFKQLADTFKWEYFNMKTFQNKGYPILHRNNIRKLARDPFKRINGLNYNVPITYSHKDIIDELLSKEDIEQEYWRIVEHENSQVIVQYGSDLDVNQVGTLFPRVWDNDWNLNRLALTKDCLLHYLHQKIPGISSPMLYIGMVFSSFCWHTEDNYLPATNFIHFGAHKTWYGVPGSAAIKFEKVMRKSLKHLYEGNPNLIHGMITQLSPRILIENDVPVYTVDHEPGTFVITLPRVFHAGFNHGFNIAESINLAPSCWVPHSRIAAINYRNCKRPTAFSHDKIFCNAVEHLEEFDFSSSEAIFNEFKLIVEQEQIHRKEIESYGISDIKPLNSGIRNRARLAKNDSDRDFICCKVCNQDCYLSSVTCSCLKNASEISDPDNSNTFAYCLYHYKSCSCEASQKTLNIRFTTKQLNEMLKSGEKILQDMKNLLQNGNEIVSPTEKSSIHQSHFDMQMKYESKSTINFEIHDAHSHEHSDILLTSWN